MLDKTEKLERLYSQLKESYGDGNSADARAKLQQEINSLEAEKSKKKNAEGWIYSANTGVFVKNDDKQVLDSSSTSEPSTTNPGGDLTGETWYSAAQVAHFTGEKVPVGSDGLEKYLFERKGTNTSFSNLGVPDKNKPDLNHFRSFDISVERKGRDNRLVIVTYIDSNGQPMPTRDRKLLVNVYGEKNFQLKYRNSQGALIDEEAAIEKPDQIYRCQFDGHNCGMYSTLITTMNKEASKLDNNSQREKYIQDSLSNIKNVDPVKVRQMHTTRLKGRGISYDVAIAAGDVTKDLFICDATQNEVSGPAFQDRINAQAQAQANHKHIL